MTGRGGRLSKIHLSPFEDPDGIQLELTAPVGQPAPHG